MRRFPPFTRHSGHRGMVHASAFQTSDGKLGVRVAFPAGSGRTTTVELPIAAARDTLTAMGLALTDARAALDLVCVGETTKHREPGSWRDEDA